MGLLANLPRASDDELDAAIVANESQVGRGARSGTLSLRGGVSNFLGATGKALGADDFAAGQYADADALNARAAKAAPRVTSLRDVNNPGDFGDWAAGTLGAVLPSAALGIGAGLAAPASLGVAGAMGAGALAYAPSEIGGVVGRQRAAGQEVSLRDAALGGGASAAMGAIVPGMVAGKLAGRAVSAAPMTAGRAAGTLGRDAALEGGTEVGGELSKQYATDRTMSEGQTLVDAAAGGALGGAAMSGVGVAAEALQRPAKAPSGPVEAPTDPEAPVSASQRAADGLDALRAKGQDAARDAVKRVSEGLPMGDLKDLAGKTGPEFDAAVAKLDEVTATKVREWATKLSEDAGLTPEKRAQLAEWSRDLGSEASQRGIAALKASRDKAKDVGETISKLYTRLRKAGDPKAGDVVGEATEVPNRPALGRVKKSEDFSGVRRVVSEYLTPVLQEQHPDIFDDAPALQKAADSVRMFIEQVAKREPGQMDSDTVVHLIDLMGDKTTDTLDRVYRAVMGEDRKSAENFFGALNQIREMQKRDTDLLGVLRTNLKPELQEAYTMPELREMAKGLSTWATATSGASGAKKFGDMFPATGSEVDRYHSARVREQLEMMFDKPDAVFAALTKMTKPDGSTFAKDSVETDEDGNPTNPDGVDYTDVLQEDGPRQSLVSTKLVAKPEAHRAEFGNEGPGERYIREAQARDAGVAARWVSAEEWHSSQGEDAPEGSKGKGYIVAERAAGSDRLTEEQADAFKFDTSRGDRETSKSVIKAGSTKVMRKGKEVEVPYLLDAMKLGRQRSGEELPWNAADDKGSLTRLSRQFLNNVAAVQDSLGRSFKIPDDVVVARRGSRDITAGELKKMTQSTESRTGLDDESPVERSKRLEGEMKYLRQLRSLNEEWTATKDRAERGAIDAEARLIAETIGLKASWRDAGRIVAEYKDRANQVAQIEAADRVARDFADRGVTDFGGDENISALDAMGEVKPRRTSMDGTPINHTPKMTPRLQMERNAKLEENKRVAAVKVLPEAYINRDDVKSLNENSQLKAREVKVRVPDTTQQKMIADAVARVRESFGPELDRMKFAVHYGGDATAGRSYGSLNVIALRADVFQRGVSELNETPAQRVQRIVAHELAHARDMATGYSSESSKGLLPGGKAYEEAKAATTKSPMLAKWYGYIFNGTLTPQRSARELFAQLHAMYHTYPEMIREQQPAAYKVLAKQADDGRRVDTREPLPDAARGGRIGEESARATTPGGSRLPGAVNRVESEGVGRGFERRAQESFDRMKDAAEGNPRDPAPRDLSKTARQLDLGDGEDWRPSAPFRFESEEPPSPKAVAAKKAAFLERARSGDTALLKELSESTDAKGLQRAAAALKDEGGPVLDVINKRLGELVQDPDVAYGMATKKYSLMGLMIHNDLQRPGFAATHDSPIKHEGKFDWRSHIGKGEGNAAFGMGTYLSTSEGVHKSYKKQFTAKIGGDAPKRLRGSAIHAYYAARRAGHETPSAIKAAVNADLTAQIDAAESDPAKNHMEQIRAGRTLRQDREAFRQIPDAELAPKKSPTYEVSVDIPQEQLLNWNAPFSEQSAYVQKALTDAGVDADMFQLEWDRDDGRYTSILENGSELSISVDNGFLLDVDGENYGVYASLQEAKDAAEIYASRNLSEDTKLRMGWGEKDGRQIYNRLASERGSQAKASDYLQSLGILGHRFNAVGGKEENHPNYVIYDDSKITTNYVHFDKSATNPGYANTSAERSRTLSYINSVLGQTVQVAFKKFADMPHAGEFEPQSAVNPADVIRISVHALDPMSVAYHESLHAWFKQLSDKGLTKVMQPLLRAADSPFMRRKLEAALANEPDALKQLDDAEERVAYMYQFWAAGHTDFKQLGPETKTIFQRLAKMIRDVLGIWSNDERALHIMQYFHTGEYAKDMSPSAVARATLEQGTNKATTALSAMSEPLVKLVDTVGTAGAARLRDTGIPALRELADLVKATGRNEDGDPGFIPAARIERTRVMNQLGGALSKYTEAELNEAMESLQGRTPATSMNARIAQKIVKKALADSMQYMRAAGVNVSSLGPDYFPRVYNADYISRHQDEFVTVLERYGVTNAREVMLKIVSADGNEFQVETMVPGMQHLKQRKLDMVPDSELAPFMRKDLFNTLNSYVTQATRRAEWTRRFGENSQRIRDFLMQAKVQGATDADIAAAETFMKGIDGTLGDTINPTARRLFGNMIVYQNIRLLPLAIFSSVVDPVGVMVRGGTAADGFNTFKRGVREIGNGFKKRPGKDSLTELAETIGTIDNAVLAHTLGSLYSQGMVGDTARKINDTFFKYNLMEQFGSSVRVGALEAAMKFVVRHADGTNNKHSTRWIKELGLNPSDIQTRPDGRLKVTEADGLTAEQAARMRVALNRWVDGAVLRPDAADRPPWMNDPHWALIAHLKSFVFSFHETIIKRVMHEYEQGNYKPAMALTSYVPIMIAADLVKGMIQGGGEQPEWKNGWTAGDYIWSGVQRAGLLGTGQFVADMAGDVRDGGIGIGALSGPTIEQFADAIRVLDGREQFGDFAIKSMPANALYAGLADASTPTPARLEQP